MCLASVMNCFNVLFVAYRSFFFAIMCTAVIFASGCFFVFSGGKLIWSIRRRA